MTLDCVQALTHRSQEAAAQHKAAAASNSEHLSRPSSAGRSSLHTVPEAGQLPASSGPVLSKGTSQQGPAGLGLQAELREPPEAISSAAAQDAVATESSTESVQVLQLVACAGLSRPVSTCRACCCCLTAWSCLSSEQL